MTLDALVNQVCDAEAFGSLHDYALFAAGYSEFCVAGLQAKILSQNAEHYTFYQYRDDGHRNVTRPINARLMLDRGELPRSIETFFEVLYALARGERPSESGRPALIRVLYSLQQGIGAVLDALPPGRANQARKRNGDLFERLIRLAVREAGVDCRSGVVPVPVRDDQGVAEFAMKFQHDLLVRLDGKIRIIGSVKTSSKDRLGKIFTDKLLYNRLTSTDTPHIAIFLNDVQRADRRPGTDGVPKFGVSSTFLPGHFRAFTVKLNPLDGIYYCDIQRSMQMDPFLSDRISTIDRFFYDDLPRFLHRDGDFVSAPVILPDEGGAGEAAEEG